MLEEAMRYVNNRFEYAYVVGDFEVTDGSIEVDGLSDGQYFWVEGSVFNDGLHQHPAHDMADEEFVGRVWLLAVPSAFLSIVCEMEKWCERNAEAIGSPYQSESYGGYSYTKANASQGNETPAAAWQTQFGARLRPWRKLSRDWV